MKYKIVCEDGTYYVYRVLDGTHTLLAETPVASEAHAAIDQDQRLRDWCKWPGQS